MNINHGMTKCKTCGCEVANSAERCPRCQAQLRLSFGKVIGMIVVVGISLLFIYAGLFA